MYYSFYEKKSMLQQQEIPALEEISILSDNELLDVWESTQNIEASLQNQLGDKVTMAVNYEKVLLFEFRKRFLRNVRAENALKMKIKQGFEEFLANENREDKEDTGA